MYINYYMEGLPTIIEVDLPHQYYLGVLICFLFYVCVGIGFVDWFDMRYIWEEFWNVHLFTTKFGCPEVTLCGWQDIKIQSLTNVYFTFV